MNNINTFRITIFIFVISICSLFLNTVMSEKILISDSYIRKNILLRRDNIDINENYKFSNNINYQDNVYDLLIDSQFNSTLPWSNNILPDFNGIYSFTWRIKVLISSLFQMSNLPDSKYYNIELKNHEGKTVYINSPIHTLPSETIILTQGIYSLSINSDIALNNYTYGFYPENVDDLINYKADNTKSFYSIPKIIIKMNNNSISDIKRMVSMALKRTSGQIINKMPNARTRGEIIHGKNNYGIEIGLSGRTIEHLKYFPSIDVNILNGNTINGIGSFKLYRLETKFGALGYIFSTVLEDMGFFQPRQFLIDLSINGVDIGLYVMLENYTDATFSTKHFMEGNVIGVNVDKMFYDYPRGSLLEMNSFYNFYKGSVKTIDEGEYFSRNFNNKLDTDKFSKYLAFASLYYSNHGFGVDDLRFYQDPISYLFSPIPRDLNPGLNKWKKNIRSLRSHMYWLNFSPFSTIYPSHNLHVYEAEYPLSTSGLTDTHFSVFNFLDESQNLSLANFYLDYFINNKAIHEQLKFRGETILSSALSKFSNNKLLSYQYNNISRNGHDNIFEIAKIQLNDKPIIIRDGENQYYWNNRASKNLDLELRPSFTSPFNDVGSNKLSINTQYLLHFLLEKKLYNFLDNNLTYDYKYTFKDSMYNIENSNIIDKNDVLRIYESNRIVNTNLRNVVTYFGTIFHNSDNVNIIYLVRNADSLVYNYTISYRNNYRIIKPAVNKLFKLDQLSTDEYSTMGDIEKGHLNKGENLRFLVFDLELSDDISFVRFNVPGYYRTRLRHMIPSSHKGFSDLYLPEIIYFPSRGNSSDMNLAEDRYVPKGAIIDDHIITFPAGEIIEIVDNYIVKSNEILNIEKGTKIFIYPHKNIEIKGSLSILGDSLDPVLFSSKFDIPWSGIYVGTSNRKKSTVRIKNAKFKNYGSFPFTKFNKRDLNGGITFFNCSILLENLEISNSQSEDALNIIHSSILGKNITITDSFSDAIDLDYSSGKFINLNISNSKGDGLDISGSLVNVFNSQFNANLDKGISVGENSTLYLDNCTIYNNNIGVANKDQSLCYIDNSNIKYNTQGFVEFIKKPYFGKPKSYITNSSIINNDTNTKWLGYYPF
tara:strand:- start:200 stop:3517 length:3318 start_codon:yes stop_codon:yes gene_type:complete